MKHRQEAVETLNNPKRDYEMSYRKLAKSYSLNPTTLYRWAKSLGRLKKQVAWTQFITTPEYAYA